MALPHHTTNYTRVFVGCPLFFTIYFKNFVAIPQKVVYYSVCEGGGVYMHTRIKQLRKELKLSQQEFAERIHISRSQLSYYESGTVSIPERSQKEICEKFNVSIDWLRTGEGEMYSFSPQDAELAEALAEITLSDNEILKKLATKIIQLEEPFIQHIEAIVDGLLQNNQKKSK